MMNMIRMIRKFGLLVLFCLPVLSCGNSQYKIQQYLIEVKKISLPDYIYAKKPFDITFYGVVGVNGCCSFDTFKVTDNDKEIYVEAWGKYENQSGSCPAVMVYLDGQKLTLTAPSPGIYTIFIKKPDSKPLAVDFTVNESH
jgi:hypothetical protein